MALRWLCDSPRTGSAWRTTPYIYMARTSNNRVILACELHCCLLPQCEALRICRSGFPIATLSISKFINMKTCQRTQRNRQGFMCASLIIRLEAATLNSRDMPCMNGIPCIIKKTAAKLTFTSYCSEKPLHIMLELFTQYRQMIVQT